MRKTGLLIIFSFVIYTNLYSQQILYTQDQNIDTLFEMNISTINEFMSRFNGEDSHPDFQDAPPSIKRISNLMMLFDMTSEKIRHKERIVKDFINQVDSNDIRLAFTDSLWFIETRSIVEYNNTEYEIGLYLKTEIIESNVYRWAIFDAIDVLNNVIKLNKIRIIDPTDNEFDFLVLRDRFKYDNKNAFAYKAIDRELDDLSVLITLIYNGQIKFEYVKESVYHFYNVPGFGFKVELIKRKSNNAGWLITDIDRT